MQNDRALNTNPYVCKEILEQVGKPDNFYECKSLNVFDNKYRVNIYTKESVEGITGDRTRIVQSYFVRLDDDKVTILSQSIYKDRANRGSQRKTVKQEVI